MFLNIPPVWWNVQVLVGPVGLMVPTGPTRVGAAGGNVARTVWQYQCSRTDSAGSYIPNFSFKKIDSCENFAQYHDDIGRFFWQNSVKIAQNTTLSATAITTDFFIKTVPALRSAPDKSAYRKNATTKETIFPRLEFNGFAFVESVDWFPASTYGQRDSMGFSNQVNKA